MHQLKDTVYSADSARRSFLGTLIDLVSSLPKAHELALRLTKRNIKALYRKSFLGFFWMLIPPLLTGGLWIFLRGNSVVAFEDTSVPYPVFVLTGTIIWQIFVEAFTSPLDTVISNKSILVKINIPRESLLLSGVYMLTFNLIPKAFLLGLVFWYIGQPVTMSVLMIPVGIISIIICGFALGIILIPVGMLYEDIKKMIPVFMPFLMYLTPVIYPPKSDGIIGFIMNVNPMAILLTETRNWFTSQPAYDTQGFIINASAFLILLIIGLVTYRISMPIIIERIGS